MQPFPSCTTGGPLLLERREDDPVAVFELCTLPGIVRQHSQIGLGQGPGGQMAEDPEQLDLQDKEGRAQSKALDQLTDNVGALWAACVVSKWHASMKHLCSGCIAGRGQANGSIQGAVCHGHPGRVSEGRQGCTAAEVSFPRPYVLCVEFTCTAHACRERELAALKISKGDIDAIASEFELDAKTAERRLREHRGNLRQALEALLQP